MTESNTSHYEPDTGESLHRRSLYTLWKRSAPPASLETFDAPSREMICPRRARANTPLQALVTMNDPQWVEAARKLAERALRAAPTADARLAFLASVTLSRPLDAGEKADLADAAGKYRSHFAAHPADAQELVSTGEAPADPALSAAELAEWTMVASQFLNLDEFLTK